MEHSESAKSDNNVSPSQGAEPFIPIIDLTGFGSGDDELDISISRQMRAACTENGFFYVVGHGIPSIEINDIYSQYKDFFSLPLEEKNRVSKAHSSSNRGYEPLAAQTLEHGAPPDQNEGFYIGVEIPESDPRVVAGKINHGPNQWQAKPSESRAVATSYFSSDFLG